MVKLKLKVLEEHMLNLFHTHGCELFIQGIMLPAAISLKSEKLPSTKVDYNA